LSRCDQLRRFGDGEKFEFLHGLFSCRLELSRHEDMRRFIAARPPGRETVDHTPDMAVRFDQVRQIFRWQIETGLPSQQNDFVIGWRCAHEENSGFAAWCASGWSGGALRSAIVPLCPCRVDPGLPKGEARPVPGAFAAPVASRC
jgi:hypothetical protein